MFTMLEWACDRWATIAPVEKVSHTYAGKLLEWPRVAIKGGAGYLTVRCPACGPGTC